MRAATLRYLAHIVANTAYLLSSDLATFSAANTAMQTAIQRERVLDGIDQLRGILVRTEQTVKEREDKV